MTTVRMMIHRDSREGAVLNKLVRTITTITITITTINQREGADARTKASSSSLMIHHVAAEGAVETMTQRRHQIIAPTRTPNRVHGADVSVPLIQIRHHRHRRQQGHVVEVTIQITAAFPDLHVLEVQVLQVLQVVPTQHHHGVNVCDLLAVLMGSIGNGYT
jgi:hypothetical protein